MRIFEFPTNERYPPITRLAVHLEGQDEVFFDEDISPERLQEVLDRRDSTLTAFFKYNAHINVEVYGSIYAVKYIHKYIYKGTDRITVGVSG